MLFAIKDNRRCLSFFALIQLLSPVVTVSTQSANESLSDLFPQLKDLERFPPPATGYGSPQNLTYCCLQAVNHALKLDDGTLMYANQSDVTITATLEEFNRSAANGQFPCTATYVPGDYNGAPDVLVTHRYCEDTCGRGWQRSPLASSGSWLQAIIGFIIPAIIFTLSIPRRWKVRIPNELFDADISKIPWGCAEGLGGFVVAAFLGALDILIWLSVCFACSGAMVLSALHEATLDSRVLQFLKTTKETREVTTDMRARILFLVLIGNLDIKPQTSDSLADDDSPYLANDSPFYHVERMVYPLRIYNSPPGQGYHPSQWRLPDNPSARVLNGSYHAPNGSAPTHCSGEHHENARPLSSPINAPPVLNANDYENLVDATKCRLHAMLECQYSFGTTVGSPVAFFIAGFIYTLVDTLSGLGDETHSLSLAFGFWWMTVPHIAIVSGLLLAGNNPNTLEGVVALPGLIHHQDDSSPPSGRTPWIKIPIRELRHFVQPAYQSSYKIAWLWQRGHTKQQHIDMLCKIYRQTKGEVLHECQPDSLDLKRFGDPPNGTEYDFPICKFEQQTQLTFRDWLMIYSFVTILLGVPFGLAFMTAYTTPTVGIACRSFTFLIYIITQVLQIILLEVATRYESSASKLTLRIWKICSYVLRAAAIFVSIGGTMMQLMGTYSECRCNVSLYYWLNMDNPKVWIEISTNSAQDIYYARKYWQGAAITAIVFLALLCLFGWWYQRRQRNLFHDIADGLDRYTRKATAPSSPVASTILPPALSHQTGTPASSTQNLVSPSPDNSNSLAQAWDTYTGQQYHD